MHKTDEPFLVLFAEFVDDTEGYWVKEKALDVVSFILAAETHIKKGLYSPKSATFCICEILQKSRERTEGRIRQSQLPNKTHMQCVLPILKLPKEKIQDEQCK